MTQMSAGQVSGISGIGSGIPLAGPVREVANRVVPDDVVSVVYDPLALTRARARLTGPPGTAGHIDAGLNGPKALLTAGWYPSGRRAVFSCGVS